MTKRSLSLTLMVLLVCAGTTFAKINKDDKAYIDDQISAINQNIKALKDQITALKGQMDAFSKLLADLQKAQTDFHDTQRHQEESLNDMLQSLNIMRQSHSSDLGRVTDALNVVQGKLDKITTQLSASAAQAAAVPPPSVAPPVTSPTSLPQTQSAASQGNVTLVEGGVVTVDLGSAQALHPGSKLALFKAGDPNTRVGDLEVTDVVDAGNCHARIGSVNPGVQPEAGDIVRPE